MRREFQVRFCERPGGRFPRPTLLVVLCRSRKEAQRALGVVKEVLGTLKLSLYETKTRLSDFEQGFEFLGFSFRHYRVGIRELSIKRFKDRIRSMTRAASKAGISTP